MRLCFYVIRSFLPSLPGRRRDADHGIKSPPDIPNVEVLEELMKGDYHKEALPTYNLDGEQSACMLNYA